jgi:hypothetical protein
MIPSNLISVKYTQGNEFLRADNYNGYQGYYYELRGKTYIGKEYSPFSIELLRVGSNQVNPLLTNSSTSTYGAISGQNIQSVNIMSIPFVATTEDMRKGYAMRYFVKKVNEPLIKETNQTTYNQVKNNSLYQSAEIKYDLTLSFREYSKYEQQIPGISNFIFNQEATISSLGNEDRLSFYNTVENNLPAQPIQPPSLPSITPPTSSSQNETQEFLQNIRRG